MACGSRGGCGSGKGCSTACGTLTTYDWLGNMLAPGEAETQNVYEVRFKSSRKGFYRNVNALNLVQGDWVVVESDKGQDMGIVGLGGELARLQMKRKRIEERYIPRIFRFATEEDHTRYQMARQTEPAMLRVARSISYDLRPDMKITELDYQLDGSRAIFYYTADRRIDFREVVREFANEFKIRVEMRQVGPRQETAIVGGIGICGRETCCSTWLSNFKNVGTSAARYQNLSLNPQKITGLCGRLKCCLNYELDTYLDALKDIPTVSEIRTEIGTARLQKTDIFQRKLWYSYSGETAWTQLSVAQVNELAELNRQGIIPPSLLKDTDAEPPAFRKANQFSNTTTSRDEFDYVDVVGTSDVVERMNKEDRDKKRAARQRKKSGKGKQGNPQAARSQEPHLREASNKPSQAGTGEKQATREGQARAKERFQKRGNQGQGKLQAKENAQRTPNPHPANRPKQEAKPKPNKPKSPPPSSESNQ